MDGLSLMQLELTRQEKNGHLSSTDYCLGLF
jgi:hypothetical protein